MFTMCDIMQGYATDCSHCTVKCVVSDYIDATRQDNDIADTHVFVPKPHNSAISIVKIHVPEYSERVSTKRVVRAAACKLDGYDAYGNPIMRTVRKKVIGSHSVKTYDYVGVKTVVIED